MNLENIEIKYIYIFINKIKLFNMHKEHWFISPINKLWKINSVTVSYFNDLSESFSLNYYSIILKVRRFDLRWHLIW
jgi:hypothetical protein